VSHVTIPIDTYFHGGESLAVERLLDLRPYAGHRLRSLMVVAQSRWGNASLTLCMATGCSGGVIPARTTGLRWPLQEPVRRQNGWTLNVDGELYLQRVELDFE
jgi:hypothetical protein